MVGPRVGVLATGHIDAQIDAFQMVCVVGRDDDRRIGAEVALPVGAGLPDDGLASTVRDEVGERGGNIAGERLHGGDGERDAVGEDVERHEGRFAVVGEVVLYDDVLLAVLREGDVRDGGEMVDIGGEGASGADERKR